MEKQAERTVQLRVDIPEALRTRLKTQSVRRGITMGDLLQDLIEKPLKDLEIEALEEAKGGSK